MKKNDRKTPLTRREFHAIWNPPPSDHELEAIMKMRKRKAKK